jgi:tRNA-guanine family transglycosylase
LGAFRTLGKAVFFCAGARKENLPRGGARNLLVNVPVNGRNENAVIKTQKMRGHFKSKVCMLDSGGFTILKGEEKGKQLSFDSTRPLMVSPNSLNIAPSHVVQAAVSLEPDILVGLDYPIKNIKDPKNQRAEFKKKLPYNTAWAIETATLRGKWCPHIELFIPVQCYTLQDFREFRKRIGGISFDGFTMPIRNLKLQEIALFLLEFWRMGIKKVHLLGTSAFLVMAVAAFFSNHFLEWVSLDSVTWRITGGQGIYLDPHNLSRVSLKDTNVWDKEGVTKKCRCRVCRKASLADLMRYPYKERCFFLWTHNLHAIETVCRDLQKYSKDLVGLERFLRLRGVKEKQIDQLLKCLMATNYENFSRR